MDGVLFSKNSSHKVLSEDLIVLIFLPLLIVFVLFVLLRFHCGALGVETNSPGVSKSDMRPKVHFGSQCIMVQGEVLGRMAQYRPLSPTFNTLL